MGINLSWIAAQGQSTQAVLGRLGLVAIGEVNLEVAADYACAELPGGWLVITAGKPFFKLDDVLATTFIEGFALGGEVVETVNYSQVRAYDQGRPLWSVTHDPEKDLDGLVMVGPVPPLVHDLLHKVRAEEADDPGVDYLFDVPLDLSEALCGYQPGQQVAPVWTVLKKTGLEKSRPGENRRN